MYLSIDWLNDFLDLSEWPADVIADRMSRTGIEIEGVENIGAQLSNLVVGYVKELTPLPDSDHLSLTQVEVANGEVFQIVCGAPNVHQGARVIAALPGAVLPGGFEIKKAMLRGVESNGMLCSLQELGFSDSVVPKKYAEGIYLLPQEAPIGADVVEYLKLDDPILELSITPNRADALSMRGAAYELGAIIEQVPQFELISHYPTIEDQVLLSSISVDVALPELSPHYQLRVIQNVEVKESPIDIQMRLMKAGIRPLNNIVDLTNYFLLLYGQPFHAFDLDTLTDRQIGVRQAVEGSTFTTLDQTERTLSTSDVLIWAGNEPIALAGVMGGLDSEVTDQTRNVLLETAIFDPQNVRLTSNKFNLRSESSTRFEKGINHATVSEASEQTAAMIALLGGGQVIDGFVEEKTNEVKDTTVTVPVKHIKQKLGITVDQAELEQIIARLGFGIAFDEAGESFTVTVPPRRWDITIEADILEEVARIYGYDRIPTTLPTVPSTPGQLTKQQRLVRQTRAISESFGLNQVISYVLTSPKEAELLKSDEHPLVRLNFPMSEDRSVLRQSMLTALLEIAKYNHARQNKPLAFYEIGKVFFGTEANKQPVEKERFAILLSGQEQPSGWDNPARLYDFYSLKGIIEGYFEAIRLGGQVSFVAEQAIDVMHPGRTAKVLLDEHEIGFMGQVHPQVAKDHDLDGATFFAELDLEYILAYDREELRQTTIPKFPGTSRDLALLVSTEQTNAELMGLIKDHGGADLKDVALFDLYNGDKITEGKQSLAYHLTFQNPEKTLKDEDVERAMASITEALLTIDGLEIR